MDPRHRELMKRLDWATYLLCLIAGLLGAILIVLLRGGGLSTVFT